MRELIIRNQQRKNGTKEFRFHNLFFSLPPKLKSFVLEVFDRHIYALGSSIGAKENPILWLGGRRGDTNNNIIK
jgi:hypothetical protein